MNESLVIPLLNTQKKAMWRWAVVPAGNPFVYVPTWSEQEARSIAEVIDQGAPPEQFINRPVTRRMRVEYGLPTVPPALLRMAHLPGYGAWHPVAAPTLELLGDRVARLQFEWPGAGGEVERLFLVAAPKPLSVPQLIDLATGAAAA
ncbi:hypothetical protein [Nocardia carnea]|uniref:hypothetical protein n=1 Tax=Nocardia carnea TaxID=37328 RepID=UPI002453FEFE|nr:hypothetical protein [Nocardia carnea]